MRALLGRKGTFIAAVIAILLVAPWSAWANVEFSTTGQPVSYELSFAPAAISGFGDARFGMTLEEVAAVLSTMFPGALVTHTFEAVQQTHVLHVSVPALAPLQEAPARGQVVLAFVFGYRSERLTAINIEWMTEADATPAERRALLDTGTAYVTDLLQYFWPPLATSRGVVIGTNAVILFAGRDSHGRGVEVAVDGVPLDVERLDGTREHRPIDTGRAYLHIRLSAQPDDPDVFTLAPGSF